MRDGFFITGTDTDCGKTFVTQGILNRWLKIGALNAGYMKPLQTGSATDILDLETVRALTGFTPHNTIAKAVVPYLFKKAASPHFAALLEKRSVSLDYIELCYKKMCKHYSHLLVEGAGGVAVPVGRSLMTYDIIERIALPVIIVVGNKLGAINHALLTIDYLKTKKASIAGLIFTTPNKSSDSAIIANNIRTITTASALPLLGEVPYLNKNSATFHKELLAAFAFADQLIK